MQTLPRAALLSLSLLAMGACGGGQTRRSPFDPGWVDDRGAAMAALRRSSRARVPIGVDVAIGVLGKKALVGVPLSGGAPWTFAHELHGRPAIAGSVVVATGGGELFALEAATGKLLWSCASAGRIRGAGDDGATTVVSLIPVAGYGSLVLAIARDGSILRQIEDDTAIGVPAVAGDTVFFPWQGRFLSAYDLPSGEERARLVFRRPVSRAFALGGVLFAGEASFMRIDGRVFPDGGPLATLPRPLGGMVPGDPPWTRPGTDWVSREADAMDKIRVYARPASSGPAAVDGGRFAATYFRVALGLDASSGGPLWARVHDADFIGGAAYRGGFALCDAAGVVTFLDAATGGVAGRVSLGKPVSACLVQADAMTTPAAPREAPLLDQLERIARARAPEIQGLRPAVLREMALLGATGSGGG